MKRFQLTIGLTFCFLIAFGQSGPNGIGTNNIFWYKASDLHLTQGAPISVIADKTSNNIDATQNIEENQPSYSTNGSEQINGEDVMVFDGTDFLSIPNDDNINMASGGYERKAMAIVFKTSSDISSTQVLYEEGGKTNGMNILIHNNNLYYGVYVDGTYNNYITYPVTPQTDYFVTGVMSAGYDQLRIYVNGEYIDQINLQNFLLKRHTGANGLGGINGRSMFITGVLENSIMGFKGSIGEMVYYNDSLSTYNVDELVNYIGPDYGFTSDNQSLPIELISFTGKSINNSNVINWSTATEQNNDYFMLERSEDGISFEQVELIEGAGNSATKRSYQVTDFTPHPISYYRLFQTDYDGTITYSKTIKISSQLQDIKYLKYNDYIHIHCSEDWLGASISLLHINGQQIMENTLTDIDFTIANYTFQNQKGVYLIYIQKGQRSHSIKFVH